MTATISAKEDTIFVDTDAAIPRLELVSSMTETRQQALVFQANQSDTIWKGPLKPQQKAINEGNTPLELLMLKSLEISDPSALTGEVIQYGICPEVSTWRELTPAEE